MTENRYLTVLLTGDIKDTVTNEFIKGSGIARRLNELAEENEQSKMMIATLRNIILENEDLEKENKKLKDKNSQLQETLAFRSNQLALMERLVDDLGSEEMARQMEEILND